MKMRLTMKIDQKETAEIDLGLDMDINIPNKKSDSVQW